MKIHRIRIRKYQRGYVVLFDGKVTREIKASESVAEANSIVSFLSTVNNGPDKSLWDSLSEPHKKSIARALFRESIELPWDLELQKTNNVSYGIRLRKGGYQSEVSILNGLRGNGLVTKDLEEAQAVVELLELLIKGNRGSLYLMEVDSRSLWNSLPSRQQLQLRKIVQKSNSKEVLERYICLSGEPSDLINEYHFKFVSVRSPLRLPKWYLDHLEGVEQFKEGRGFLSEIKKDFTNRELEFSEDIAFSFWKKGIGICPLSRWKEWVDEDFLNYKITVGELSQGMGYASTGLHSKLLKVPSYIEHISSEEYSTLISQNEFRSNIEVLATERLTPLFVLTNVKRWCGVRNRKFELDLFLPKLNIAFEFNGYYWHSSKYHDKGYHRDKTEMCLKQGIKLYHLWENKTNLILNFIDNKIGRLEKWSARRTKVKVLDTEASKQFFSNNHFDGHTRAFLTLALITQSEEVLSAISFRPHPEGAEIARFASKSGITVVGGFSKLLKHSLPLLKEKGYKTLISYCNRDLTPDYHDSVYFKQGFQFLGDSGPILKYYCSRSCEFFKNGQIVSRQRLQKHLLEKYNLTGSRTEKQILEESGLYQVWNSGNWKFFTYI